MNRTSKWMTGLLTLFWLATLAAAAKPAGNLTVGDGLTNPLGSGEAVPYFSWKLPAGVKQQSSYRLEVTDVGAAKILWDSGWVTSDQSVRVLYGGPPLVSRQRVEWRVDFRDENGREAGWSKRATFETGLLSAGDWQAQWIRPPGEVDPHQEAVGWLRRGFVVHAPVARARVYVTARGLFELNLNGARVGTDEFANGWTSYQHRLDTLTYDVTDQLQRGTNRLLAQLGSGWFAGHIGWGKYPIYGPYPELLLQLEITYRDGSTDKVVTDGQWEGTFNGPALSASIYDGVNYDARRELAGWMPAVAETTLGGARLQPKSFPPVRPVETLQVQAITEPLPGHYVFDLGQNMVGHERLHIPVDKDGTVTIHVAEMLNTNGTLYMANYRRARSTDTYTAAKNGTIDWEPEFTFHGFRYVELTGLPAGVKPRKSWVTGVVLHSDLPQTGRFECSNPKLNQLQSNIVWGQRGNFVDIPTDCPQRDERLGWTGDAEVFSPTALFNYGCGGFWKSWLGSMRDDQLPDGRIPNVIPDVEHGGGSPGWVEAATIIPWEVYVRTGDTNVLADNFAMMERLVGWYRSKAVDGRISAMGGFGDWLQPYAKKTTGDAPEPLLANAYSAHDAQILADAAAVLGRTADAQFYAVEATGVRDAFARHYFAADGRLQNAPETQTAYLLALAFNLLPPDLAAKVPAHLVRLVHDAGDHLRTGFLGTPHIVPELDRAGLPDLAGKVLLQETYPSWLFPINQGATTMWERWNSYSRKDGFGNAGMNSFNHYAYGAIGQYLYERIAGLAPDPAHPGYKHFFIRPLLDCPLTSARAELNTPYGQAVSSWFKKNRRATLEIVVPSNTTATVELPGGRPPEELTAGKHRLEVSL